MKLIPTLLFLLALNVNAADKPLVQLQQEFLNLRFGMFIHFNMATYQEREWGDPKASPRMFNPAELDTDGWAAAAKSAGMTYGVLTTKHHDGFCIWPTATSSPSVKDTPFRGDVVKSYVDSFRKHGLRVGLYYSILDLRADIRPRFVTREKVDLIKAQLTELLTNYGDIDLLVFDGWDAGWSRLTYNDVPYHEIYALIKKLQPHCLVSEHNAAKYPGTGLFYSDVRQYEQRAGQKISLDNPVPSQSGTTLQSAWFWKKGFPRETLRPVDQIVKEWLIPFNQAHCNLILNVAPNRQGKLDPNVVRRLEEIGTAWKHPGLAPRLGPLPLPITTPNLAELKKATASSSYESGGPDLANDGDFSSAWICDSGQRSCSLEVALDGRVRFNTAALVEDRQGGAGSRIKSYRVDCWDGSRWVAASSGGVPAAVQTDRFKTVTAERVRLSIEASGDQPAVAEFGVYLEP